MLRSWSKEQDAIALSSGEAELYAATFGATVGLGMQSLAADLDIPLKLHMFMDASAEIGALRRQGLGRMRHVEVKELWMQEAITRKRLTLSKVPGKENTSDIGTKPLNEEDLVKIVWAVGGYFAEEPMAMLLERAERWSRL